METDGPGDDGVRTARPVRLFWLLAQTLIWMVGVSCWGVRCWNQRRVPRRGGVILAANHQSYLDPPLVGSCMPREISFMARRTLFEFPLFGRLISYCNAFPIDRTAGDVRGLKTAIDRLKGGDALLIFPEGTRSRDGRIGPMKGGIRVIAQRAGVPILPVLIDGAREVWPKGRPFPGLSRRTDIYFGEPVSIEGTDAEFGDRLREAVLALKPPGRGTVSKAPLRKESNVESKARS